MKDYKVIITALLIYMSTLVLFPQSIIYIVISIIGLIVWLFNMEKRGLKKEDLFFILVIAVSFFLYFIGKPYALITDSKSLNDFIPYTFFLITTINFSRVLNKKILMYILYFILFETVLGLIQYGLGIPYFIAPSLSSQQEFVDSEYLYYNKVYGLSAVTSVFAMKIFIGVLITHYLKLSLKKQYLYYLILGFGLIATFNRTSIVAATIFTIIVLFQNVKNGSVRLKFLTMLAAVTVFFTVFNNIDIIENQFFRGKELDMSGRDMVFPYYLGFIEEHFFFGNFFSKHWVELQKGRVYHAHNSYLQTFANMGVFFGGILIVYILRRVKSFNYLYLVPILIYSGFQYGILWGVSFLDIIFFYFLFNLNESSKELNTTVKIK